MAVAIQESSKATHYTPIDFPWTSETNVSGSHYVVVTIYSEGAYKKSVVIPDLDRSQTNPYAYGLDSLSVDNECMSHLMNKAGKIGGLAMSLTKVKKLLENRIGKLNKVFWIYMQELEDHLDVTTVITTNDSRTLDQIYDHELFISDNTPDICINFRVIIQSGRHSDVNIPKDSIICISK